MKKIILMLIALILCSCSAGVRNMVVNLQPQRSIDTTISKEGLLKGKAIVIYKGIYNYKALDPYQLRLPKILGGEEPHFIDETRAVSLTFSRVDEKYNFLERKIYSSLSFKDLYTKRKLNEYYALMLDPGKYVIEDFTLYGNGVNYSPGKRGWNKNNGKVTYAQFEVNPQEIIYLGDIQFIPITDDQLKININDDFISAKKAFLEAYPEFTKGIIIKKRLFIVGEHITL